MNPSGICKCGCGGKAPLRKKGNLRLGLIKGEPCDFIGNHGVRSNLKKGTEHHKWNGGKKTSRGYVFIWSKEHPRADTHGYVPEHILVAEELYGPLPKGAVVHHINGIKHDNRIENLVVFNSNSDHMKHHTRERAFIECGNPDYRKCPFCKTYDNPRNMVKSGRTYLHRQCRNLYQNTPKGR